MSDNNAIQTYCSIIETIDSEIDKLDSSQNNIPCIVSITQYITDNIDIIAIPDSLQNNCPKATPNDENAFDIGNDIKERISMFAAANDLPNSCFLSYYIYSRNKSIEMGDNTKPTGKPEDAALQYLFSDRTTRFSCVSRLFEIFCHHLPNENKEVNLMHHVKTLLVTILTKGYVDSVLSYMKTLIHNYNNYSPKVQQLICEELQAAAYSLFNIFKTVQMTEKQAIAIQQFITDQHSFCEVFNYISSILHSCLLTSYFNPSQFQSTFNIAPSPGELLNTSNEYNKIQDYSNRGYFDLLCNYCLASPISTKGAINGLITCLKNHAFHSLLLSCQSLYYDHYTNERVRLFMTFYQHFIQFYLISGHILSTPLENPSVDGYNTLYYALISLIHIASSFIQLNQANDCNLCLIQCIYNGLDHLNKQPSLFNDLIALLISLIQTSEENAIVIYDMLNSYQSNLLNIPMLVDLPCQLAKQLSSSSSSATLSHDDCTGFIALLQLLAAFLTYPSIQQTLFSLTSSSLITTLLSLLTYPLSLELHAALCDVLTSCCSTPTYLHMIVSQLEQGCIIHSLHHIHNYNTSTTLQSGLQYALDVEEAKQADYPLTTAFLLLFDTIVHNYAIEELATSKVLYSYLQFVIHDVLMKSASRQYHDHNQYYQHFYYCIDIINTIIQGIYNDIPSSSCIISLIAELLSSSPLTTTIFSIVSTSSSFIASYPLYLHHHHYNSWYDAAITQTAELVHSLLQINSTTISSHHLQTILSSSSTLVTPFCQQLLNQPQLTLSLLHCITKASQPFLQTILLKILYQLTIQTSSTAFFSFFTPYINDLILIRSACVQIIRRCLYTSTPQSEWLVCCNELMHILLYDTTIMNQTITSLLCDCTHSIKDNHVNENSILYCLIHLITTPYILFNHLPLAGHMIHLLYQLCCVESNKDIIEFLLNQRIMMKVISILPFLIKAYPTYSNQVVAQAVAQTAQVGEHAEQAGEQVGEHAEQAGEQAGEQAEAILECFVYLMKLLIYIFYSVKVEINITELLTALFEYDASVVAVFQDNSMVLRSPIMDIIEFLQYICYDKKTRITKRENEKMTTAVVWNQEYEIIDISGIDEIVHNYGLTNHIENEEDIKKQIRHDYNQYNNQQRLITIEGITITTVFNLLEIILTDCYSIFIQLPLFHNESNQIINTLFLALFQLLTTVKSSTAVLPLLSSFLVIITQLQDHHICIQLQSYDILGSLLHILIQYNNEMTLNTRHVMYLLILRVMIYYNTMNTMNSYTSLINSIYAELPSLLTLLSHDIIILSDSASSLLMLILVYDKQGHSLQYLISSTDLIMTLLTSFNTLTLNELERQTSLYHHIIQVLIILSHTTDGAVTLLQHSLFGYITHCPLIIEICHHNTIMMITANQKKHFLLLLKLILQLFFSVNQALQDIRSVHVELIAFILSISSLTSFLFKERENQDLLSLEVLGLYVGILAILAEHRDKLIELMNGYENVLRNEVLSLLNYVSKLDGVCSDINRKIKDRNEFNNEEDEQKKRNALYLLIVENGMLFMNRMGWKIGDEYLRAFGVKN